MRGLLRRIDQLEGKDGGWESVVIVPGNDNNIAKRVGFVKRRSRKNHAKKRYGIVLQAQNPLPLFRVILVPTQGGRTYPETHYLLIHDPAEKAAKIKK
jgi:hypothetical protein